SACASPGVACGQREAAMRSRWFANCISALVVSLALFVSAPGSAAQWGEGIQDQASVHDLPNGTAPVLGQVRRGDWVPLSSEMAKDVYGEYWYKTRTEEGQYGYVRVEAVRGDSLVDAWYAAGYQER